MDIHLKAYFFDLLTDIEEIDSFFEIYPKTFEHYQENVLLKRAVERNVTIIGEAMGRILKNQDSVQLSNARKIVDLRIESCTATIPLRMK
jgi:uncharacterized protein with HEPN domain